jgi:hypothetical protein
MGTTALGKTQTELVKFSMSDNRIKENNPFYKKKHTASVLQKLKVMASNRGYLPVAGIEVKITDLVSKITTVYSTKRKAALAIHSEIKTILRREK